MNNQNNIRGPASAMTDFLRSQGISSFQIQQNVLARQRAAQQADQQADQPNENQPDTAQEEGAEVEAEVEAEADSDAPATRTRSKRKATTAKTKKAVKKPKKAKKKDDDDDDDDDDWARQLYKKADIRQPGQRDNCAVCKQAFTVTVYTITDPNGGLLCHKCSRKVPQANPAKKRKKFEKNSNNRKIQSNILDGKAPTGVKSLVALCVDYIVKNIDQVDDLGAESNYLPEPVMDKVARHLSKRRVVDPRTAAFFATRSADTVNIYDCAKLTEADYIKIFQVCPGLHSLKLYNAIQFKSNVVDYIVTRNQELRSLILHGANLLPEACWHKYIKAKGHALTTFKVYYTDQHFGDESAALLETHCKQLKRLKIYNNQMIGPVGLESIANVSTLEHLSLNLHKEVETKSLVNLITKRGPNLKTLVLKDFPGVTDEVLNAIHTYCTRLEKLTITDSEQTTDAGFVNLFQDWQNRPLKFIDFSDCRHLDANKPRDNQDQIGLCSAGFAAMMRHSGEHLEHINVHACRHITKDAFEKVFKQGVVYHKLRTIEISFIEAVNDYIVGLIFKACPNVHKVNVFGCMKVKSVKVPRGKILVGVPNAMGMQIEGR